MQVPSGQGPFLFCNGCMMIKRTYQHGLLLLHSTSADCLPQYCLAALPCGIDLEAGYVSGLALNPQCQIHRKHSVNDPNTQDSSYSGPSVYFILFTCTRASHCCGLSHCRAQAPDAQAQQPWLTGPAAPRHVGSSWTGARTCAPCIGRRTPNHCATREAPSVYFSLFP